MPCIQQLRDLVGVASLGSILACGPSVAASQGDATSSTSAAATTGASEVTTQSSDGTTSDARGTDGTTGTGLDCESHTSESCPEGCVVVIAHPASEWICDVAPSERPLCVAAGDDVPRDYASVWWREIDGEALFVLAGQSCADSVATIPSGWSECTGTADEPDVCRCLCVHDECPGEQDIATLERCTTDTPCPPTQVNIDFASPDEECVFAALRDRIPGLYDLSFDYINDGTRWRVLVTADGVAQATSQGWNEIGCPSSVYPMWTAAHRCELASPEFFQACLDSGSPVNDGCAPDEQTLAAWLVDCVVMPATCE